MTPVEQVKAAVARLAKVKYVSKWDSASIAGKGAFTPRFVMLHHTAGTSSLAYMTRPNGEWGPVRLAHFLIDRDGTVHVCAAVMAYHAGKGGPKWGVAAGAMNHYAWGIEIEDLGRGQTMTDAQIQSAAILTAGLIDAMGVTDANIVQHKEWNPSGKTDTRYSTDFWLGKVKAARAAREKVTALAVQVFKHGSMYKTPLAKPLKLTARKAPYDIAVVDLPAGKECLLTFQVRTLKNALLPDLEVEFVRLGWPGLAKEDGTGHSQIAPASKLFGVWHRWRTVNHAIKGGGKVAFRVFLPEGASGEYRFVAKSVTA